MGRGDKRGRAYIHYKPIEPRAFAQAQVSCFSPAHEIFPERGDKNFPPLHENCGQQGNNWSSVARRLGVSSVEVEDEDADQS
jgi:hypothetical protein